MRAYAYLSTSLERWLTGVRAAMAFLRSIRDIVGRALPASIVFEFDHEDTGSVIMPYRAAANEFERTSR